MGQEYSTTINGYGWSQKEAIDSLDALLYYKYGCRVINDESKGIYYVIQGTKNHNVYIYKLKGSSEGPYKAFIKLM